MAPRPNKGLLAAALDKLGRRQNGQVTGIPEGLVVYVVLGCEWLLRVRRVGKTDVEAMLGELERGLAEHVAPEAAYWVTEVLAKPLRRKLMQEGRRLLSLDVFLPVTSPEVRQFLTPGEPAWRVRPERLVPRVQGRMPWPAPWVAGALIRELLRRKGVESVRGPLELTQALFGQREVGPSEFKTQTLGLTAAVLGWWAEGFAHRYGQRFGSAGTPPELWGAAFRDDLLVLGAATLFPGDPGATRELLLAYASRGRPRPGLQS